MGNGFEGFSTFDAEVRKLLKELMKTNKDNDGDEEGGLQKCCLILS
jgi:hypothetical protein